MKDTERDTFLRFLLSCSSQQFNFTIKTLTPNQLQVIVEIVFNVLNGVCPVSNKNKIKLHQKKRLIREIILPKLTPSQRKRKLQRIKTVLPIFLEACLKHVAGDDSNTKTEI